VPQPQPGEFHHDVAQTWIACFGNALLPIDSAAALAQLSQLAL
jgi:hypothetical protein